MKPATDRIERSVLLHSPKPRVWHALTDAEEFGAWFGVKLDSGFAEGQSVTGQITYPGYQHLKFKADVDRLERERLFSFRWHPAAVEPDADYSKEPTTLVEFRLEEAQGGTKLTITESGFERIPAARRDEAFQRNSEGWSQQVENIKRHVTEH
jgi:uncharacterized protein YndB with AHSA1/START domain